jgi:toxin-antitoxin system PIN domain toxin
MIAVETNILVYAHRGEMSEHGAARLVVTRLAEGSSPWAIPWPCLHEFLGVVTHPRVFTPPSGIDAAIQQVEYWLGSPSLVLLSESDAHWSVLRGIVKSAEIRGPRVHDARIAAICLGHGVRELLTADRDFSRFPALRVRNPLVQG